MVEQQYECTVCKSTYSCYDDAVDCEQAHSPEYAAKKRNDDCPYCGRDTKGSGITMGEGRLACRLCYEQHHPPTPAPNFHAMMMRPEGRDFVTAHLEKVWSPFTLKAILRDFNCVRATQYAGSIKAWVSARCKEESDE